MRQRLAFQSLPPLSGEGKLYQKSGIRSRGLTGADIPRDIPRDVARDISRVSARGTSRNTARDPTATLDDDGLDQDEHGLEPIDWTEEEIVFLHWRLLKDVQHLADPATPLDEKLSTLRWIFTEADKDARPFSFVNCLRVVGCSPLSPIAYCGRVDSDAIREHIVSNARRWLTESLTSYPDWVAHALADNPAWVEAQLDRNPQCINEQVRQMAIQGDLFA